MKSKVFALGLLSLVIVGAVLSLFISRKDDNNTLNSTLISNNIPVSTNSNGQIIKVGTSSNLPDICISSCTTVQTESGQTPPSPTRTSNSSSSNKITKQQTNKSSLPDHWWDQYLSSSTPSTPMPDFDYDRPTPTLQTPPQPSCGNTDSSYYANCLDSYCRTSPDTSICSSRQ